MHDIPRVRRFQAVRDLHGDFAGLAKFQGAAANFLRQRFAVVKGHDDEGAAVAGFFHAMNHADIRMIERRGRASFLQKALAVFFVGIDFRGQKLQRHSTLEFQIERLINHTHATRAGHCQNLVIAYAFAGS